MTKTKIPIKDMTLMALFAGLTALLSQIQIPLPISPVPINLAMLSVFVAGGLLGGIKGGVSQLVYVLIGCIGIPVFAGFKGGFAVLVGPTGGYILGYIVAAVIIGFIISGKSKPIWYVIMSMIVGLICCYAIGTAWFMFVTRNNLASSLTMCVIPFLLGDALKIVLASILVNRLKVVLQRTA